ncbi:MAG: hypothetical protein RLZZ04_1613 [Cyanobacteriota bacterium]|jgi:uncharacterized repeat protein (TIGR01451 family)
MKRLQLSIVKYFSFLSWLGIFTILPRAYTLASTPGATNYVDPSGYALSWPSAWTSYTVNGLPLADQTNGGGDGTKGAAPSNESDVAPCGGQSVLFARDGNNIYFRMCLNGNPSGGNSSPYSTSTSWSLLIDVDGDGYREFVVSLDGKSSQGFDVQPDNLYVLYKNDNRQDFVDSDLQTGTGGSATVGSAVLWVQDAAKGNPVTNIDGESNWNVTETNGIKDFKRTRIVNRNDGTYYLDIQVPIAALDATNLGGTKITATTPIAFAFSTAASNTDPVQKDLAYPGNFTPAPDAVIPFGDVVLPDGTTQSKPSIKSVTGGTCGANSSISAEVIDSLKLQSGSLISSISQVQFLYYADLNGNGIVDDGESWVSIGNGTLAANTINPWTITWNTTNLNKGKYLLKAVATDDQGNIVDSVQTTKSDVKYNAATNETTPIVYSLDNTCGVSKDYGDAPDSYGTNSTDNNGEGIGANHIIVNTLKLGASAPDSETDAKTPLDGTGDDNNGDDEDGISTFPSLDTSTSSYSLTATVNNTTGSAANVYGWLDFDHDGKFDGDERATVSNGSIILSSGKVPNNSNGTVTLTWNNIGGTGANITDGNSYARIRLTTDNLSAATATTTRDLASVGLASNGEVEDYPIAIAKSYDYGDAPSSFGDASHDIPVTPNVYLGVVKPDKELGTQLGTDAGAAAVGDDSNGTPDDEDAFTTLANVSTVGNYNLTVPVHNTSGANATLHAWIDFNKNGKFESGEYKSAAVNNNATSANLNWTVPIGTLPGSTHARFRLTTDNALTDNSGTINVDERSLGTANNGEVEDYLVTIAVPIYDYGDAPDGSAGTGTGNYQTTAIDGGAAQVKINTAGQILSLGSNIDTDDGSLQNATADADDTNGTPDDEDGIASFPALTTTANQTYTVPVTVSNNVPLLSAYLVGYIDFNQDGDFLDAGEKSTTITVPSSSTNPRTVNVTFTTPAGMTTGNTYARFRLGQVQATAESATGASLSTDNGEIEDYQIAIAPRPELLLVKRITAINPGQPGKEIQFSNFVNDSTVNDNHPLWPNSNVYLRGVIDAGKVEPNDVVEYTVYFLSSGDVNAKEIKICDAIPDQMTFVKNTYGVESGIGLGFDSTVLPTSPNLKLSNLLNDDQGDFYGPGTVPPANLCKKVTPANTLVNVNGTNNDNGVVVVKIPNLPKGNTPGSPTDSYGFIRFRGKVK